MKFKLQAKLIPAIFFCFLATLVFAKEETAKNNMESEQSNQVEQFKKTKDKAVPPKTTFGSVEERRLYTILQNERDSLEEEKKVLALREKELKTLEEEADKKLKLLDEKLDKLKKVQKKIESLLAEKNVEEQKKIQDLGMIYAKMTPEKAAQALGALDLQLAADLLANIKVKSAAKILDRLDKVKASQLSETFTTIKVE
jgi:flagellar motility protein MotE (MotC chaperone)